MYLLEQVAESLSHYIMPGAFEPLHGTHELLDVVY